MIFITQYGMLFTMKKWLNFFLIFVISLTPIMVSSQLVYAQSVSAVSKTGVSPCSQKAPVNQKGQCNTGQTMETNLPGPLMPSLLMALISFIYLLTCPTGVPTGIYKPPRYSPVFI
jgi:hypothetical protein